MFVHLDPRRDGVSVPDRFRKQPQLVLQLGLNMAVRIPDLEVTEEGITATLSFNRTPHWCGVPWAAVFALVGEDGRGMVWPDDVPPELAAAGPRPKLQSVEAAPKARRKPRKRRAKPRPVDAEPAAVGEEGETKEAEPGAAAPSAARADGVAGEADDFGLRRKRGKADRPALAVVPAPDRGEPAKGDEPEPPSDDDPEGDKPGGRKLPPYLRVIK